MDFRRVMFESASSGHRQVLEGWQAVSAQPAWVNRIALTALLLMILVVAIPIVLLVLCAMLVMIVVFAVLALGYRLAGRVRQWLPRRDGRSNVRVIGVTRHPPDA